MVVFQEFGIFPLSSFDGHHLTYEKVIERQADGGHTTMEFRAREPYIPFGFPLSPVAYDPLGATLKVKSLLDNNSHTVASETVAPHPDPIIEGAGLNMQAIQIRGSTGMPLFIGTNYYRHRTSLYRIGRKTTMVDGVTTITDFEYGGSNHFAPTAQEFTNSTGKKHRVETRYPEEFVGAAYDAMDARNLLRPIQSLTKVGDDVVDGTRTQYRLFNGHPYPSNVDRFEVSWDADGNRIEDGWETNTDVFAYKDGYPTEVTNRGWEKESFTWDAGGADSDKDFQRF